MRKLLIACGLLLAWMLAAMMPAAAQEQPMGVKLMCWTGTAWTPCQLSPSTPTGSVSGSASNASSGVAPTSTNVPTVAYNYNWNGLSWDQQQGLQTGVAGAPGVDVVTVQPPITAGSAGFPVASTPITGNATGSTGAVVGTLAANATKTTYICGFSVSALGTANTPGPVVIAGLVGSSQTYQMSTLATGVVQELTRTFPTCLPASAINTAITVTTTAAAGGTAVDVNSWGFQQ